MNKRFRYTAWGLLTAASLLLTACGGQSAEQAEHGEHANHQDHEQSSGELAPIMQIKDFTLTNTNHQQVSIEKDLTGKAKLVYFFFANCPDVCPVSHARMANIMQSLEENGLKKADVQFISITVDPENDTPDKLAEYMKQYQADPNEWAFLTGSEEELAAVRDQFGVLAEKHSSHDISHNDRIFLLDAKNQVMNSYNMSDGVTNDVILNDMKKLTTM
ncbi:protein SCO1/2 [Tumebacillus sp. BK434]|uniref:SCO family protein n=1 Tax=Tumebacillus sp. BK434 TaxID=2512169 RepID=UPI0010516361|nr:SCO family protein [Tumebacillus sp. BK434]TCP59257.1 protein SCO1/2 [Tumebacillus sp. BK434]